VRNGVDGELAVRGRDGNEFAAGEFFRRAALVGVDVRGLRAEDGLERPCCGLQAQDVGGSAVEDEEDLDIAEVFAEFGAGAVGVEVVAIADRVASVGGGQGCENLGMHPGIVVAGETADGLRRHQSGLGLGKFGLNFGKHQVANDRDIDDRANEAEWVRVEERAK